MTGKRKGKRFTRRMQRRLLVVFSIVLGLLVGLLIYITYTATKDGRNYAKQVLSQENYDSKTIPYRRGQIMDRNGIILAKSDLVYNVIVDSKVIVSKMDTYLEPTLEALQEVFRLSDDKMDSLRSMLNEEALKDESERSQYYILLRKISVEEREAFEEYISTDSERNLTDEEKKKLSNVTGIWFEDDYKRDYPYGSLACDIIGFSNSSDVGTTGIENYYNDLLNGTNGRTYGYLNEDAEFQRTTIDPEHGKNLVTTIDMNIQQIVEKYIAEFDEEYGDEDSHERGAKDVGVVVMDPNTGEILALADNSGYDLNDPEDLSQDYTKAELKKMTEEEYDTALFTRWSSFCYSASYEPGSVVKPITVASALEAGAVHDGDAFYCDGGEFITDTQINCDNVYGHGDETLEYGIVNSCNDVMMQIGMQLGITNFLNYQKNFGFGNQTGIDLPNESAGVVYNRNNMHEVELATNTFGQGFTCSMIQEIAAFSAVINGGIYYQPHVLKQVQNDEGTVEKTVGALALRQLISTSTSSLLRQYITTAVQEGTGRKSQVPGYLTGGKTGTAEKIDYENGGRLKGKYLVSFIGACPMDDPQVVIYVVVDEPNVDEQADSSYAQILFRKIATEVYPYMGLYPTEEVSQELLSFLGLTQSDIVQSSTRKTASFQAFDSYGNLYNDAYVNGDNEIVSGSGTVIEGAYIDEDGNVVDGYGNVIEVQLNAGYSANSENGNDNDGSQIAQENPNIASPPQTSGEDTDEATVWAGVTSEDLEDTAEEEE